MKNMKTRSATKTLYLLLLLALLLTLAAFSASATDRVTLPYSAPAGENCTFHWYEDGTVVITGTGEIDSFLANRPYYYYPDPEDYWWYRIIPETHLIISEGITGIGESQFKYCEFESVSIPESLTSIGLEAFWGCRALTSITIPGSVIDIGEDAFRCCEGLTSATISGSEISIGDVAFCNCTSLTSITLGSDPKHIGVSAFYDTGFYHDRNNWDENALYLGGWLLTVDETAEGAFTVKDKTKGICRNAASGCTGLTSIAIPDGVTSIGIYAFYGCTGLTSVIIPKSVKSIGGFAFGECDALSFVYYCGNSHDWDQIEIDQTDLTSFDMGVSNCELLDATRIYNYGLHFHDYTPSVTTPATCIAKGVKTFTCDCGESYTEEIDIDPTNHVHTENVKAVTANCKENGFTAGVYCSDCKTYVSGHTDLGLDPNNHAALNENGDCPRCGRHIKDVEAPAAPEKEEDAPKLNFFQRIIQWFKNLFSKLFGR